MLFLFRSAVCIGLVVSALPDRSPTPSSGADALAAGTAAFGELCRIDAARCRTLADVLLMAEPGDTAGRPRSLRDQPGTAPARLSRSAPVL